MKKYIHVVEDFKVTPSPIMPNDIGVQITSVLMKFDDKGVLRLPDKQEVRQQPGETNGQVTRTFVLNSLRAQHLARQILEKSGS